MALTRELLKDLGLEKEAINQVMKEHGQAIEDAKPSEDIDHLKTEIANYKADLEAANNTKTTYEKELEDLKEENKSYKLNDLRVAIALENNIPYKLAHKLSGDDEESLRKDAESLAEYVSKPTPSAPLKVTEPNVVDNEEQAYKNIIQNLTNEGE